MGVVEYRSAPLLAGYRFAAVAVADNGQEPPEPVEIGVVVVDDGTVVEPYTSWLVRPPRPVSEYARRAHGITDAHLRQAPPVCEVAHEIRAAIGGRIVVAHRAQAVADLLDAAVPGWSAVRPLDVRRLSRRVWPASVSRSLGELVRVAGLSVAGSLGRAGHDALATALLFLTLARHAEDVGRRCDQPVSVERLVEWATLPESGPAW